jgi:hypothetical protein
MGDRIAVDIWHMGNERCTACYTQASAYRDRYLEQGFALLKQPWQGRIQRHRVLHRLNKWWDDARHHTVMEQYRHRLRELSHQFFLKGDPAVLDGAAARSALLPLAALRPGRLLVKRHPRLHCDRKL